MAVNMAPKGPRKPQESFEVACEPPKDAPKRPTSLKNVRFSKDVCLLAFSASDGPLWPQGGPKMAKEGPPPNNKGLQEHPKRAKTAPRGNLSGPKGVC